MATVLENIYNKFWGGGFKNYEIYDAPRVPTQRINGIPVAKKNHATMLGYEVFLPVEIGFSEDNMVRIDCCTIKISSNKTVLKTELSERKGTVKRIFGISDYVFTIKGVLIGDHRLNGNFTNHLPWRDIEMLKRMYETPNTPQIRNALIEIFNPRGFVVITNLEFPEVEGKVLRCRPFVLTCESDSINNLILEE